jgi:hypothetical protein
MKTIYSKSKLLFFTLIFPFSLFSQSKEELSKKNNDLTAENKKLLIKIDSLNKRIDNIIKSNDSTILDINSNFDQLKKITRESNRVFNTLTSYEQKFTNKYLQEEKFEKLTEEALLKIKNAEIITISILLTEEPSSSIYKLALKVRDFNKNRLVLDSITKNVLDQKYDSLKINSAILQLDLLKPMQKDSEMEKYKSNLTLLLTEYKKVNCLASIQYEKMSKKMIETLSQSEQGFDKSLLDGKFNKGIAKEYTYLMKVFNAIKNDPNNYNMKDIEIPATCEIMSEETPK